MFETESKKLKTDKELIKLLQEGNDTALTEIISRYKQKLFCFINAYIKDNDTSEDILQQTFVKLYFKATSYNSDYSFSNWLYQIAINLCRDYSRKQKLHNLLSLDQGNNNEDTPNYQDIIADPNSNVENLVQLKQDISTLNKEISKLPHKLKTALILFILEGYSQKKCAQILNVTSKTIESRVYRARKILAKKIATNS